MAGSAPLHLSGRLPAPSGKVARAAGRLSQDAAPQWRQMLGRERGPPHGAAQREREEGLPSNQLAAAAPRCGLAGGAALHCARERRCGGPGGCGGEYRPAPAAGRPQLRVLTETATGARVCGSAQSAAGFSPRWVCFGASPLGLSERSH